jgi:hypothetical protein
VTTPARAREAIAGTIFEGSVDREAYESLRQERSITQAYLVEGEYRVRVHEPEGNPPEGFQPVTSTLEDAYLVLMRGQEPASTVPMGVTR